MIKTEQQALPKKIWFLWLQGQSNMPEVVQRCYESWRRHNHNWDIILLDAENLPNYLKGDNPLWGKRSLAIPKVSVSEIVRINLLEKHGGLWVDASCFCCQPLDEWLPELVENSGYFAFSRPGKDRMIASWFMAALPNNELAKAYAEAVNIFWTKNSDLVFTPQRPMLNKLIRRSGLYQWLKKNPPRWLNFWFQRVLKVYPYYWFHYTFEKAYQKNSTFRRIWESTPKIDANIPHLLWNHGLDQPITDQLKESIRRREAPLYKLTWKVNDAMFKAGNSLHYLLYHSEHNVL